MKLAEVTAPDWGCIPPLGITGIARLVSDERAVLLPTTAGYLRLSFHDFGLRVQIGRDRAIDYGILEQAPRPLALTLTGDGQETRIQGGEFDLHVDHQPFSFTLRRGTRLVQQSPTDGHFVRRFRLPPLARLDDGGWFVSFHLEAESAVYGLGEKWGRLDRRGQLLRSYNQDALGVNAEWSYKNAPFAWSPDGWGVFVHTPAPVTHGIGYAPWSHRAYGLVVEDESLDLFLLAGNDGAEIIGQYTNLTGRAPVPPLWSLGLILSKAYYRTADEILAVARELRERKLPCDTITFDGRAWQDTDTRFAFEWDPVRYSDPYAVVDELKALDFKICVWEYPLISIKNPLFSEMAAKGWLLKDRRTGEAYRHDWDPEPFGDVLTQLPPSGIVDFTHPDAYAFWRDKHKPLFDMGVDMIKADFGEQISDDMLAYNGETGRALHNVYALLYNRCVYEAAQRYAENGPFLFSRAGWSGSQRYPAQWGGDPQADWEGLAASIRGGLSWGMSGAPFYASDVGGFYKDMRDPQLYVRWCQAAIFSAHIRLHGVGPREPYSYGEPAATIAVQALHLRYRLLPYIRLAVDQSSRTGLPVQRAMALAFPDEPLAWSFEHQFMFGDDILVVPCLNPDGLVRFYLPRGEWRRFEPDGRLWDGGSDYSMTLRLDELAVFVRAGRRVPLGAERPFIGHAREDIDIVEYWPH